MKSWSACQFIYFFYLFPRKIRQITHISFWNEFNVYQIKSFSLNFEEILYREKHLRYEMKYFLVVQTHIVRNSDYCMLLRIIMNSDKIRSSVQLPVRVLIFTKLLEFLASLIRIRLLIVSSLIWFWWTLTSLGSTHKVNSSSHSGSPILIPFD